MIELMQCGKSLDKSLREAWADPVVRDRHLIAELQRRSFQRKRPAEEEQAGPSKREKKRVKIATAKEAARAAASGKGGDKKKGSGKGKCAHMTPDGEKICYPFNKAADGCTRQDCSFAHVCGVCFKKGTPMSKCGH